MADFSIKVPGATTRVKLPLQLDIPLARKVKAELGWDLLRPSESPPGLQFPLIQVLHRDLEAWANVLHMLCAKRLQELGLTDDEFLVSLDSQAVSEARQGFWDMWHDFFFPGPSLRRRQRGQEAARNPQAGSRSGQCDRRQPVHRPVGSSDRCRDQSTDDDSAEPASCPWELIDELAGQIGINPDQPCMTLGRLLTMAHARQRANWAHTAAMLAELMNGPRQRRDQRAWQSRDLDPFAAPQPVAKVSPQEFIQALRSAWM